jgi:hypothetical protein
MKERTNAMTCWFWNISRPDSDYFNSELGYGRLRQGWAYDAKLDLRKLKEKLNAKEQLDNSEMTAWTRCSYMLLNIQRGDLVVVKNVPSGDQFTIVRVDGEYSFTIDPAVGDFGHYLPIVNLRTYNRFAVAVSPPFQRALSRAQSPIVRTFKHEKTVRDLYDIPAGLNTREPEAGTLKLERIRGGVLTELKKLLKAGLLAAIDPGLAENLILHLLRQDGMTVTYNGGSNELGADILASRDLGYGLTIKVGVQVKYFQGVDNSLKGLSQLEQAFEAHQLDAGLLVSFADQLSNELLKKLEEMKKTLNVEVLYGENLYERLLSLVIGSDPLAD